MKKFQRFAFIAMVSLGCFLYSCKKKEGNSSSSEEGFKQGDVVEVEWKGSWYKATILEANNGKYKIHYEGYGDDQNEEVDEKRIRKIQGGTAENTNNETQNANVELEPGKFPFDFPVVESTDAKEGDKVFAVNMGLIKNSLKKGDKTFQTQYLICTMGKPGSKESDIKFVSAEKVPNSGIIKIPANESVKVGDIVAGVWAVNMTRGIIVDANGPKAVMIGIGYDNPAKADDKQTPIGQYAYTLKKGEFINITNIKEFAPSSCCAVKKDGSWRLMEVFKAEGDKVMGTIFTEFTAVNKSDCVPIPLKPDFKVGDEVYAPWVGGMYKGKCTKIDEKNGRVTVDFGDNVKGVKVLAFGEVIKSLPE